MSDARAFGTKQGSWLTLALLALLALVPATAEAKRKGPFNNIPVSASNLQGTFTIHGFYHQDGKIWASGVVDGRLNGQHVVTAARAPVTGRGSSSARGIGPQQTGSCDILLLDIGPIHLDVLGLVIDISPIVIDIDAERGPGNLLGNLLCALLGLFDELGGGGPGELITQILNQIVALLNELLDIFS